jgi:Cu(I)/Ag(I) efflux system membrane fusion protein
MKKIEKYRKYMIGAGILLIGIFLGSLISNEGEPADAAHSEEEHSKAEETWTCSMHPQIRALEPGQCPICGMDLIRRDESGMTSGSSDEIVLSEEAFQLANVQTSVVGRSDANREIRLLGTVKPDEGRLYSQVSHLPGRIERLYVGFTGEYIRRGQRIVRLYSPELISAQKELLEAIKSKEVYPKLYEASRNKLKLWKISDGQIESIIASGEVQEQIDILAEHSGYVMKRNVEVGDHVTQGKNLYEIANLERVWIMFDAYESDLPWIHVGDEVEFQVRAIPGREFRGKVTYIDPFVSRDSRVAKLRVEVPNGDGKLLPEMYVNGLVRSRLDVGSDAIIIPKSAVLWTGKRGIVYVKAPGTRAHAFRYREVQLGADLGDFYVVLSGLEEGEEVATNGVFRIDASAQLSGKTSMMNPERDPKGSDPGSVEVDPAFREQLGEVVNAYMRLKDNLVESKDLESSTAAKSMREALDGIDRGLLDEKNGSRWDAQLERMQASLQGIVGSDEIDGQRKEFKNLSSTMSAMVQLFGWSSSERDTLYLEYCPMADEDQGGYWLSYEKEIRNPYFGAQMLQCGEVIRTITR